MKRREWEEMRPGLVSNGRHLPYNPDLIPRARELRKTMTKAEKLLWEGFLRHHRCRFLRQRPIDHFIVDFYCPEKLLAIEIDGDPYFTENGKERDAERTQILECYGLCLYRFTNSEVEKRFEWVCQTIENLLYNDE